MVQTPMQVTGCDSGTLCIPIGDDNAMIRPRWADKEVGDAAVSQPWDRLDVCAFSRHQPPSDVDDYAPWPFRNLAISISTGQEPQPAQYSG